MTARKIAYRREHTGTFAGDQQQRSAQKAGFELNAKEKRLQVLENRAYVQLAANQTLAGSAGVYTTLLTTTITTLLASGFLILTFTASGTHPTTANATTYFKLLVDGAYVQGAYVTNGIANAAWTAAIVVRAAVTKGAHTVTLQWSTDNNSARIAPLTSTNEHADLLVQEAA